jgi:membrane-associated protease RseP (regulator of RpoE activity)
MGMEPVIYDSMGAELKAIVAQVLQIEAIDELRQGQQVALRFRGQLHMEAEAAYAQIAPQFQAIGRTALLQDDAPNVAIIALPALPAISPARPWIALLLFVLTVASTIYVGGQDFDLATGQVRFNWGHGIAFSAALLGILGAHELGHFFAARREKVAVSYPFFIPMPFAIGILGTLGAFISIKEPVPNRRALLAIAISGPLAGLVVAIPVLILGLLLSEVKTLAEVYAQLPEASYITEGNSLLYAALKILVFGRFLPSGGEDVFLHPVALAGWAGLLVTGLNLLPAGQLDGGHIFFALFGARAAQIMSMLVAVALLAMGFLWSGWFLWAVIVAMIGQQHSPLLNEVTPLRGGWRQLALVGLVVFVLVFTPIPITISSGP